MPSDPAFETFMESLLAGDRVNCRHLFHEKIQEAENPRDLYDSLLWPAMEKVNKLYRNDRINIATEHMASRINRCLADQLQHSLPNETKNGKRIMIVCSSCEPEELGAQMAADIFESNGWEVFFLGGGVPNDEILQMVGTHRPDILMIYGTQPQGVPEVRQLIDMIREIGTNPTMNILISGGVFNRAEGLWKEVHADLYARTLKQALQKAEKAEPREHVARDPNAPKKRRRRRPPPLLAGAS